MAETYVSQHNKEQNSLKAALMKILKEGINIQSLSRPFKAIIYKSGLLYTLFC